MSGTVGLRRDMGRRVLAERFVLPAVLLGVTLVQLPYVNRGLVAMDEGALQNAALRLLEGEVLYRDVNTMIAPGSYYLQALLYKIAGVDIVVGRLAMLLINTVIAFLLYAIGRTVMPPLWAVLPPTLYGILLVLAFPVLTMFNYSPLALVLVLAVLRLLLVSRDGRGAGRLFAGGVLLGLAVSCKQSYGFVALIAAAMSVVGLSARLGPLVWMLAGVAAVGIPQLAYYAGQGALRELIDDTILDTLTAVPAFYYHPIPSLFGGLPTGPDEGPFLFRYLPPSLNNYVIENGTLLGWRPTRRFYLGVIKMTYYLPIGVLVGGICVAVLRIGTFESRWRARVVTVFSAALFLTLFPNSGAAHLVGLLPPVLIVAAWLGHRTSEAVPAPARRCLGLGVAGGVVAMMAFAGIVGRDLVRWHSASLDTARGRLLVKPEHAAVAGGAIEYIRRVTPQHAEVLVLPYVPIYYFLAERRNPTRFDLVLPGNVGSCEENEIIDVLEKKRTEYVLVNPMPYPDFAPFERMYGRLSTYLDQRYQTERVFRSRWTVIEVRRRRDAGTAKHAEAGRREP
jgi:hypothetical protein